MAILLIRHGETPGNAARIVQHPDTPLSDRGIAQAERLARRLVNEGVTHILSSDLQRAVMTTEPLQAATSAPVEFDPVLQERNFGDVRGTPYSELGFDLFAQDFVPANGEGWAQFDTRVDAAWERIRTAASRVITGHLAVVTHGLVCASLATRHLGITSDEPPPARFGNTALTVIDAEPPWTVRLLGCTAHLDDTSADDTAALSGI